MNAILLHGLRPASNCSRTPFASSGISKLQYIRLASSNTATSPSTRSAKSTTNQSALHNGSSKSTLIASTASAAATTSSPLNGPSTTQPAALDLPIRHPDQKLLEMPFFVKHMFKLGKSYATFYKTGVKNIYANYKLAKPLQDTIKRTHNSSLPNAISAHALTRSDFQLLVRNSHDIRRIPLFGLVFLICGEFTPLVVIALSSVVPWTCRIPRQIAADRRKLEARRSISFRNLTDAPPTRSGAILSRQQLIHISWSLGLSSSLWDYLGGQYPGLPTFILRRKVERKVRYIEMDDSLIKVAKVPLSGMDIEEVRMALVERGVDILGAREERLRDHLSAWMKSREISGVETLLLSRPSAWLIQTSKH